jgi:O-antigen/teichoic acid export membrane protein
VNKRRAGAIASYAYSFTQVVVNLIYVPLLLKGIGQSEYGLYQMIGSIIAYLGVLSSTLSAGATRYYCKYFALGDEEGMANTLGLLKRIYRIGYLVIAAAALVSMGLIWLVYDGSFTPQEMRESWAMLAILALNLSITLDNTLAMASITAHEEFVFLKLSQLFTLVMQPMLVLMFIKWYPTAVTVSVVQLLCNLLCRTIQTGFAKKYLGMDTHLRYLDKNLERQILAFSGTIVLGTVADQVFWKTDQLILGYMYSTSVVAIYSVGSQIVSAYSPLGIAVSSVFMPKVSEIWHKRHDLGALSDLFVRVSRIALYPLLAVLIGFIVFGRDFIRLWAGDGYELAYWVTVLELVPFTVDVAQNIGLTILQVMNRYGFRAKMYLVAASINIVLTVIFASTMGIVGAALASGIALALSSGLVLNIFYQRSIGLDMGKWWKSVARETVPLITQGILASFVWRQFEGGGWISLGLGLLCWAVSFTLVSYFLSANEYERNLVKGAVDKLLQRRGVKR